MPTYVRKRWRAFAVTPDGQLQPVAIYPMSGHADLNVDGFDSFAEAEAALNEAMLEPWGPSALTNHPITILPLYST